MASLISWKDWYDWYGEIYCNGHCVESNSGGAIMLCVIIIPINSLLQISYAPYLIFFIMWKPEPHIIITPLFIPNTEVAKSMGVSLGILLGPWSVIRFAYFANFWKGNIYLIRPWDLIGFSLHYNYYFYW